MQSSRRTEGVSGRREGEAGTYDAPFPVGGSAREEEGDGEDVDILEFFREVSAEGFDVGPVCNWFVSESQRRKTRERTDSGG